MASKHLTQETTFQRVEAIAFICAQCKEEFCYENDPAGEAVPVEPKFCPECGRRNANAK